MDHSFSLAHFCHIQKNSFRSLLHDNVWVPFQEKLLYAGDSYLVLNDRLTYYKSTLQKPDWLENKSSFKAIPLNQVLAEVERQYNVEITFENIDIRRLFTGIFVHDNLDEALKSITLPMNMTYEISSTNLVTIHGNKD